MKTKQKLSQAGLDITRAWLGPRMLGWGSVSPGAQPQAAGGTLSIGQRQGAPGVPLSTWHCSRNTKVPPAARYAQLPAQVPGRGAR